MSKWAILWRESDKNLAGPSERLIGRFGWGQPEVPDFLAGYTTMVFETREAARKYKRERYGYIGRRADLRRYPHGWLSPKVVKVRVRVEVVK